MTTEWIRYQGRGTVPCAAGLVVEIRCESGAVMANTAGHLRWRSPGRDWPGCRIVAWRPASPDLARVVKHEGLVDLGCESVT